MFHDYPSLLEQVQADHLERLTLCQTIPLKRRRRERLTPNTALIAEAAKAKALEREQSK